MITVITKTLVEKIVYGHYVHKHTTKLKDCLFMITVMTKTLCS